MKSKEQSISDILIPKLVHSTDQANLRRINWKLGRLLSKPFWPLSGRQVGEWRVTYLGDLHIVKYDLTKKLFTRLILVLEQKPGYVFKWFGQLYTSMLSKIIFSRFEFFVPVPIWKGPSNLTTIVVRFDGVNFYHHCGRIWHCQFTPQ